MHEDLVNTLRLDDNAARTFAQTGALKLSGLFTPTAIEALRAMTDSQLNVARGDDLGSNFGRLSYDIGNRSELLRSIYDSSGFRRTMAQLVERRLIFTQGLGFEMQPGRSGFQWHFGLVSYNYIHPLDFGCSLWIPLNPIRPQAQGGGMTWVPTNVLSAQERFVLAVRMSEREDIRGSLEAYASQFTAGMFSGPLDIALMEEHKVELDFDIGDALLFSKFVWHRSCTLGEGPLDRRLAFVMRMVDHKARYAPTQMQRINRVFEASGEKVNSDFGAQFQDLQEDQAIGLSNLCNSPI